jgi:molybdenum cofactor guanylyltransferase
MRVHDRWQTDAMSSSSAAAGGRRASLGAVLAGGRSSRMGAPKAMLGLAGRPLGSYPVGAVVAAGLEPVVVAKDGPDLSGLGCRIVREPDSRTHPAAGVLAALEAAEGPVVVVACDMPFVPSQLVGVLAQLAAPVAVPMLAGRLQPLLARYEPSVAPALERALALEEPLRDTVMALEPMVLGPDQLAGFGDPRWMAFNVNDRDDLATAEQLVTPSPTR